MQTLTPASRTMPFKRLGAFALICLLSTTPTVAWDHPTIILNMKEIEAIKAKVKAGEEPWKSAAAKTISTANGFLGKTFEFPIGYNHVWSGGSTQREIEAKFKYEYDHHRRTAEKFGTALGNVAMAWHLTGEQKYVTWSEKSLYGWFLDPRTFMEPKVPGGTTVGVDASFTNILSGMDLIWPALDAEIKPKLMAWVKAYDKAHLGHRDGGMHNRGDAWAFGSAVTGAMAENRTGIDLAVTQMKKRLDGLKKMSATQWALPDEGKGESTIQYNYFDIKSVVGVCEVARHFGVDIYNYGPEGGVSKMEGLLNWYAALMINPKLYPNYDKHLASRGSRFLSVDFNKCYSIWEVAYAYKPNQVYMDVIKKKGRPIGYDENEPMLFVTSTLSHARGAYPFLPSSPSGSTKLAPAMALPIANAIGLLGAAAVRLDGRRQPEGRHPGMMLKSLLDRRK